MPTPRFRSHPTSRVPHHPHIHDADGAATASGLTPQIMWALQPTTGICCSSRLVEGTWSFIKVDLIYEFFDTFSQGTKISPQGVSKDCVGCAVKVLAAESEIRCHTCHNTKNGFRKEKLLTSLYNHFYSMYKYMSYTSIVLRYWSGLLKKNMKHLQVNESGPEDLSCTFSTCKASFDCPLTEEHRAVKWAEVRKCCTKDCDVGTLVLQTKHLQKSWDFMRSKIISLKKTIVTSQSPWKKTRGSKMSMKSLSPACWDGKHDVLLPVFEVWPRIPTTTSLVKHDLYLIYHAFNVLLRIN